jgi:hypothetical protein
MLASCRVRSIVVACVAVSLLAFVMGCGSKAATYPAGGKVTYRDGKPLAGGWVTFRSTGLERPVTARGLTQPDGTFKLSTFKSDDGAVLGRHKAIVAVTPLESKPEIPVDMRFASFDTSGLEFTVTDDPAQNSFVIQVTPPKH